jgi:hypothetical protein
MSGQSIYIISLQVFYPNASKNAKESHEENQKFKKSMEGIIVERKTFSSPYLAAGGFVSFFASLQVHLSSGGTSFITASTCWPHPAHVVFLQVSQITFLHIVRL